MVNLFAIDEKDELKPFPGMIKRNTFTSNKLFDSPSAPGIKPFPGMVQKPQFDPDAPIVESLERIQKYEEDLLSEGINPPRQKKVLGTVNRILNILRTGEYAVGGLLAGEGIAKGIKEQISPSEVFGITVDEQKSFWDLLKTPSFYGALAVDILFDPVTYLTFGFGSGAKLATSSGTKILNRGGSKLLRKAAKQFGEDSARKMMATRIMREGGEKYLAKGGLKFMGKQFLPRNMVQAPFKGIDWTIAKTPIVGRTYKGTKDVLKKAFRPMEDINSLPAKVGGDGRFEEMVLATQKGIRGSTQRDLRHAGLYAKAAKKAGIKDSGKQTAAMLEFDFRTGNNALDDIADFMRQDLMQKGFAEQSRNILAAEVPVHVPGYLRHLLTDEGREFLETSGSKIQSEFVNSVRKFKVTAPFAKRRKIIKFIDEEGNIFIGTPEKLGLEKLRVAKGLDDTIKAGEAKTINEIEDILTKKYGIKLRFKPQQRVRRTRLGYFDPIKKEIVIAAKQPTFDDVLNVLKHEVTHSGHFQMGGNIEMLETFTGRGKFTKLQNLLDETKTIAKKEHEGILKAIGIDTPELLSSAQKTYFRKPTELIAYAASTWADNPALAKRLFPNTTKQIEILTNDPLLKTLRKSANEQLEFFARDVFVDKNGKLLTRGKATINDINTLYQDKYGIKLFEEDAFKAYAQRTFEHHRAVKMHDLFQTMVDERIAIKAPRVPQIQRKIGQPIKKVTRKTESTIIDGVKYVKTKVKELDDFLVPEPIAKHIDMVQGLINGDEIAEGFLKTYDKTLRFWKGSVTGWFPAFHTRNYIGGMWNNWLAGLKNPKWYKEADKLVRGKSNDKIFTTKLGTKIKGEQILREIEDLGVSGAPGMIDVMKNLEEMMRVGRFTGVKDIARYPRIAMEAVEDRLRVPLYLQRRMLGDSPEQAAKQVFRFHFDYAPEAFSQFERNVMRRIIPFYTWTRNNVPLQIEQILKQPGKFAGLEKARQNISKASGEEALGEEQYLPEWMKEMFIFRLPGESKEGLPRYLQLDLPIEDINKLPFTESGRREIIALLSPFIKYPVERIANRNIYFGSEIYDASLSREYQTSKTMEALRNLPQPIKNYLNFKETVRKNASTGKLEKTYEMDSIKLHAIRSILGRFYSTIATSSDGELEAWMKLSRVLGGVPVRAVDINEEKFWRAKEQEILNRELLQYLKRRNLIGDKKQVPIEGLKPFPGMAPSQTVE